MGSALFFHTFVADIYLFELKIHFLIIKIHVSINQEDPASKLLMLSATIINLKYYFDPSFLLPFCRYNEVVVDSKISRDNVKY